ncbi:MAG: hypothetical protein L0K01_12150 [Brachybacterium sp.]|nr:hypothetical protein [Brachybacterium sp.]
MNWDNATAAVARALDERDTTWHLGGPIKKFVEGAKWQRADLRTDEAVERVADGLYQHDGSDRRLIDHEKDCVWEQCTLPDSYRREARAVIAALLGDD